MSFRICVLFQQEMTIVPVLPKNLEEHHAVGIGDACGGADLAVRRRHVTAQDSPAGIQRSPRAIDPEERFGALGRWPGDGAIERPRVTDHRLRVFRIAGVRVGVADERRERLVLERFPEIAKVRVHARGAARGRAGEVLVVVLPGPAGVDAVEKLVPRAGVDTRARIQASLQAAASPFARILVVDPIYVRIAARVHVLFRAVDGNAAIRLNDDLCDFLSPCSGGLNLPDDAGLAEIRAAIGAFIESRPYVASMISLELKFTPDLQRMEWCVPTSAVHHDIVAEAAGPSVCVQAAVDESTYA